MSGDCGHGWGYHDQGVSGPCSKCEQEKESNELAKLKRQRDDLLAALKKIASPTQTESLTWWQIEARAAIAAEEGGK